MVKLGPKVALAGKKEYERYSIPKGSTSITFGAVKDVIFESEAKSTLIT